MGIFNQNWPVLAMKILRRVINLILDLKFDSKRPNLLALSLNNISCIYKKEGGLKESLQCLNWALKLIKHDKNEDTELLALTYLNSSAVIS